MASDFHLPVRGGKYSTATSMTIGGNRFWAVTAEVSMHPPRRCMASQPRQTSLSPPTASSYSHKLKLGACGSRNPPRSAFLDLRTIDILCASRGNIPSAHFIMTRKLSACSFGRWLTDGPSPDVAGNVWLSPKFGTLLAHNRAAKGRPCNLAGPGVLKGLYCERRK